MPAQEPPLALLAELTHRCPLRCGYCSNPEALAAREAELDTATWLRVVREAAELGVLQLHLSGGEPLLRDDLDAIVAEGKSAGLYSNLITSGWGLDDGRVERLARAGLDHVQVSVQDTSREGARRIAGVEAFDAKLAAARAVKAAGLALSINAVIHRGNIARVGEIVDLAASLGAERIEVANTQYHGWALTNRDALLPSRAALALAADAVRDARARHAGRMQVIYVLPDYFTDLPKPCMDGWGRRSMTVAPDGRVLPCPGASTIASLRFESVTARSLEAIWRASSAFIAYRGDAWMPEPCASCDRKEIDYGGCRCQAFALTGDAARTDPACAKSPDHPIVLRARARAEASAISEPAPSAEPSSRALVYRELRRVTAS